MSNIKRIMETVTDIAQGEQFEQFRIDARDFLSAREQGESAGTQIAQMNSSLDEVSEVVNRSFPKREQSGNYTNVISPVVVPKSRRYLWLIPVAFLTFFGLFGQVSASILDAILGFSNVATIIFGPHYWGLLLAYAAFSLWKDSFAQIPDGCQALITRFGKLEAVVGPGQAWIFNPWSKVSYIVNTTKQYPYNAPIREAPTESRVNASVDLFLQFRIEDPVEFIFTLGSVKGFAEKLENAISEVTRALIYEQKAEAIYDLIGENTQSLLTTLNRQFLPAVRFMNANITHAEPSSQEYRMDLAAPEMVRVAKEAYTYQYELKLRKEQDEGDLNKELVTLRESLSEIRAAIATSQAQIDTSREREINRANAYARQLLIEADSEAKANAALLEAQALDIRAMSSAYYPEILEYRFQQDILDRLEAVADRLPQMVQIGAAADANLNVMQVARQMMGLRDESLYTAEDLQALRERVTQIGIRVKERMSQIDKLVDAERPLGDEMGGAA
ncbi:MAG: SPFH domain-containing protein [Chloroflexales bacterium]|nr:SPFH domain-containing protein [Chloroflexales bacterium]